MVVVAIIVQKNGETVYFDQYIPQVHYMRLVSCSLYNSWHNLKVVGEINSDRAHVKVASIPQGYYNLESLVKKIKSNIDDRAKQAINLQIETDNPNSALKIINPNHDAYPITVSHSLAGTSLGAETYVKKLNSPSAYYIHCDLIDNTKNFFNGKRSDFLAKIDIRGSPYHKVTYPALPQKALHECSTYQHINQITLSVKDEDGEMFDFNGMPMEFVLELN